MLQIILMQFFHISRIIESYHLNLKPNCMNKNLNKPLKTNHFIVFLFLMMMNLSCNGATKLANHQFAYITNQGDNTVSVIDTTKNKVIQSIAVGKAPVGVAVSARLQRVYITNVDSQDISIINTQNNKVIETLKIKGSPVGVTLSADNKVLYVADWFDNQRT